MLRLRFMLPLLAALPLAGCGEEPFCDEPATRYEFSRDFCQHKQTCNGGQVGVWTCQPRGAGTAYTVYVQTESDQVVGFVNLEGQCTYQRVADCGPP